jgi:hypothetical protein
MARMSKRHLTAWVRFNEDLMAFTGETGEEFATLYEDAYTTRQVKGFEMTEDGILTWWEYDTYSKTPLKQEREQMMDEDDAREWLSFWRANLRRARRYWEMDTETLDRIQDGELEDMED